MNFAQKKTCINFRMTESLKKKSHKYVEWPNYKLNNLLKPLFMHKV